MSTTDIPDGPGRYEIVFDTRDRLLGNRLVSRIESVMGPTYPVQRGDSGPTWSVMIDFPHGKAADRFFSSDFYRQLCIEIRRSCNSPVLVVPMGPPS